MTDDGFTGAARPRTLQARSGRRLLLLIGTAAVLGGIFVGALLQFVSLPSALKTSTTTTRAATSAPPAPDALAQITPFTGNWQGSSEKITIDTGNGVVEILRQSQRDDDLRIDHLAAAPIRLQPAQGLLELETAEGVWRLALLPGEPRPSLRIIYADGREATYE